jgi:hypothetical protein
MPVTTDIVATWRRPGAVFDRLIRAGRREDLALSYAITGGILHFIAATPSAARMAYLDPSVPLEARLFWLAMTFVFLVPLVTWFATMFVGWLAKLTGSVDFGYRLRLTLFWSLVAAAPAALLMGMTLGFIGHGLEYSITAFFWVGAVLVFVFKGLTRLEWKGAA